MKCQNCGITIPEVPEDASYDMMLCDKCYDEYWDDCSTVEPIPEDWPVQPLKPGDKAQDKATCGHCGLSWDDGIVTSMTPAPSARCPFEAFHIYEE
jgi:hypothetical protein